MYANHGALVKHQHRIEGINSRLDGLQAAILSVKLKYILDWTDKRIAAANLYTSLLKDIIGIEVPLRRANSKHSYHLFVVKAESRDELRLFLQENGVACEIHYPTPLPFLPAYKYLNSKKEDYLKVLDNQNKILSLPIFPEITEEQITYVVTKINEFYNL
jgi:dTDP-4-amino-4,6-dideoxygalactose transaminase